jgi:hypothetical protein
VADKPSEQAVLIKSYMIYHNSVIKI